MTETIDKRDTYNIITDKVIDALENGTVPWRQPWATAGTFPLSLSTKKPYRGINLLLLSMSHFDSPWWGTYKKITEAGGQVRKGEKSTLVTFWKTFDRWVTDEATGESKKVKSFMLRYYTVFNADQADWEEGKKPASPTVAQSWEHERHDRAEAMIKGYPNAPKMSRSKRTDRAFYVPASDRIELPTLAQYKNRDEFYSTAFHELTHSTGHPSRLARKDAMSFTHFGDQSYAKEELVAEMGAAFLCGIAGIDSTVENSAAYLRGWLRALKNDKKLLVSAAAQAQRAADHILGVSFENEEPNEDTTTGTVAARAAA